MRIRPEVETRNLPTNGLALEKIWEKKTIKEMWFHHNDQFKDNTITTTLAFLMAAKVEAINGGFIDVVVRPTMREGDECSLEQYYIVVEGYRIETDEEYKKRLTLILNRDKFEHERVTRSNKYFESDAFNDRRKLIQEAINAVPSGKKSKKSKKSA